MSVGASPSVKNRALLLFCLLQHYTDLDPSDIAFDVFTPEGVLRHKNGSDISFPQDHDRFMWKTLCLKKIQLDQRLENEYVDEYDEDGNAQDDNAQDGNDMTSFLMETFLHRTGFLLNNITHQTGLYTSMYIQSIEYEQYVNRIMLGVICGGVMMFIAILVIWYCFIQQSRQKEFDNLTTKIKNIDVNITNINKVHDNILSLIQGLTADRMNGSERKTIHKQTHKPQAPYPPIVTKHCELLANLLSGM